MRPIVAALLRTVTSAGSTPVRRSRATAIFSAAEIMKRRPCQVLSRRLRAEYAASVPGGADRRPPGSARSDTRGVIIPLDSDDSRAATVQVPVGHHDERRLVIHFEV